MEHFKEGQYDDDLTKGSYDDDLTADIEEYDEDFDTGDVDLFGYTDDEDSVLGRLKSIILSIEWEITDDILRQFNEELLDLKNIWAGNKVNLIYVQALEKISRYIYKEKSSAHPNAIKLLLTFYTNLEKIVSDDTMSELQQKKMLRADINLFEKLKKQISESSESATLSPSPKAEKISSPKAEPAPQPAPVSSDALIDDTPDEAGEPGQEDPLLNLKAIVYGIDWEITERDLNNLSREVKRLEKQYSGSKAKKIFLQGIGSLGAYINLKRSDAHADAFKLLHSFYMGLETVVRNNLGGQAEKDVLLPEVEKFNNFKGLIADTIAPEKTQSKVAAADEEEESYEDTEIKPAFADVPGDVRGYQAEDESPTSTDATDLDEVDEYFDGEESTSPPPEADSALANEMESRLEGMFDEPSEEAVHQLDKDRALKGVDVETEDDDDSDEEPLPEHDGELAPALAAEDVFHKDESPAALADKVEEFEEKESLPDEPKILGKEVPGVDVEHEADDDSDEEPLPFDGDEFAPALSNDNADVSVRKEVATEEPSDIDSRLDDFFGESTEEQTFEAETVEEKNVVEESGAAEGFEQAAVEELEPEEEKHEVADSVKADSEIDGRIDDFFGDDSSETPQAETEDPIKGVDVETPDDDDSDEEPLPLDGNELAPALSIEDERVGEDEPDHIATPPEEGDEDSVETKTAEFFADDSEEIVDDLTAEDKIGEDETGDVDARFDELFGDTEEDEEATTAQEIERGEQPEAHLTGTQEDESDLAQVLEGVDVETPEDDDSEEEPLPLEDGEFAPALGSDDATDQHAELSFSDEAQEHETAERFDDLFGTSEEDVGTTTTQEDELSLDNEHVIEDVKEEDSLSSEVELAAEEEQVGEGALDVAPEGVTDYAEAGFEEIWDEDIEEIPEDMLAGGEDIETESQQKKEKEEILAYFADDAQEEAEEDIPEMEADELATVIEDTESSTIDIDSPGYASPDELLQQFDDTKDEKEEISAYGAAEEDDIPEMEVDDLATVIDEGSGVTAAGAVPSGYPSADELLRQFGEVAGEEQIDDIDDIVMDVAEDKESDSEEEEVVFEAVDESLEPLTDDPKSYEDDDTFGITLLDDGEYGGKAGEKLDSGTVEEEVAAEAIADIQTSDDPRSSAYVKPHVEIPVQESLSGMRNCIASLGLEIDSNILDSMNVEIEKLRHTWMDKPAEKTFIQLLSTIAAHINRYRYESDQEANKLLLSVFDKLELTATGQADNAEIQESLLNETSKVLQWQARLIDRVPATTGSEESSTLAEGVSSLENQDTKKMLGEPGTDEDYSAHLEDMSRQVDEIGNDMLMQKVSTIMKTELDQLKTAFQSELMELRKEILRGGKDS